SASSIGHQQPEMPLLVFVYVDVFGVDDVVIGSTARTRGRRRACCRSLIAGRLRTWRWSTLVKRLGQFMRSALQPVESVVQLLNASFGQRLLRVLNRRLNFRSNRSDFLAILAERLLHLVNESIEAIARFDLLALANVVRRVRLGILHHLVDLILRQTRRGRDRDLLLATRAHVFR